MRALLLRVIILKKAPSQVFILGAFLEWYGNDSIDNDPRAQISVVVFSIELGLHKMTQ